MFSIIAPLDANRLEQFAVTKRLYDAMPQTKEFILPTREFVKVWHYLDDNGLTRDVRLIPYKHERGFNPSKALNIGVRTAKYDSIIITSPEVKPTTPVLEQLSGLLDENVLCQVSDQDQTGNLVILVGENYRCKTPALYFLAMFKKADIEAINGWDEEFMQGYAYEDTDFGDRWMRAGLPFTLHTEIQATHQYHPRAETIPGGMAVNLQHYHDNTDCGVVRPEHGLAEQ
jgi:hypothetical protein